MALFPLLNRNVFGGSDLARRLFDDDFGASFLDGELFDPPFYHQRFYIQPRNQQHPHQQLLQQRGHGSQSCVASDPDKFALRVDVRHFAPEEITVKTVDNCVVVHGKHEEKSDDAGSYVKREFTRRYVLPDDVDPHTVTSSLSAGGLLAVEAPRKTPKKDVGKSVAITVHHEGKPNAAGDAVKSK
ncbi:unnamed protein product [Ixodes hexagonus]